MRKLIVEGNTDKIEIVLFLLDIIDMEDVSLIGDKLHYLIDGIIDYIGNSPIDIAVTVDDVDELLPAVERMRQFADNVIKAIDIPHQDVINERKRRRA